MSSLEILFFFLQVRFYGIIGNNIYSDMALDDVAITAGECDSTMPGERITFIGWKMSLIHLLHFIVYISSRLI